MYAYLHDAVRVYCFTLVYRVLGALIAGSMQAARWSQFSLFLASCPFHSSTHQGALSFVRFSQHPCTRDICHAGQSIACARVPHSAKMEMAHQVVEALCRLLMGIPQDGPGNIMHVGQRRVAPLADFGISDMCASTLGIRNGTLAACLDYAAPERVISDARVTDQRVVPCGKPRTL
jgi:hypothetical protein